MKNIIKKILKEELEGDLDWIRDIMLTMSLPELYDNQHLTKDKVVLLNGSYHNSLDIQNIKARYGHNFNYGGRVIMVFKILDKTNFKGHTHSNTKNDSGPIIKRFCRLGDCFNFSIDQNITVTIDG